MEYTKELSPQALKDLPGSLTQFLQNSDEKYRVQAVSLKVNSDKLVLLALWADFVANCKIWVYKLISIYKQALCNN